MLDPEGAPVDDVRVEELANAANFSLRTGCFCNPGAGEAAFGIDPDQIRRWFGRDEPVPYRDFRQRMRLEHGRFPSAIRVSVGIATNFGDVHRFVTFLESFLDRSAAEIDGSRRHE
jgi:selenocysteine lyase/cysteine desulfurase